MDVSAFAAVNAVARAWRRERGKVLCLLELDGECAEVSLMRDGLLLSSRAIPISGGSAESLRRELERTSAEGIAPPAKVLVSGGSEQDCRHLTEGLGVPAEPWSPGPSPVSASGYGLALKGLRSLPLQVDLLPPERRKIRRDRSVLAMVTLLALSGVLAGTLVVHRGYQERTTLDLLKACLLYTSDAADE